MMVVDVWLEKFAFIVRNPDRVVIEYSPFNKALLSYLKALIT